MIVRLLLILSLVAQLALSHNCCSISFLWTAMLDAEIRLVVPGTRPASECAAKTSDCGSKPSSCGTAPDACSSSCASGEADRPCGDAETPCDNGDCDTCPPPLPQKLPDGKVVKLILPTPNPLPIPIVGADRSRPLDNHSTVAHRRLTNHARQAWLERWLN